MAFMFMVLHNKCKILKHALFVLNAKLGVLRTDVDAQLRAGATADDAMRRSTVHGIIDDAVKLECIVESEEPRAACQHVRYLGSWYDKLWHMKKYKVFLEKLVVDAAVVREQNGA